jgi:hypothetical protein
LMWQLKKDYDKHTFRWMANNASWVICIMPI